MHDLKHYFQLLTRQIDPLTNQPVADEIENLYIEPYFITITTFSVKSDGKNGNSRNNKSIYDQSTISRDLEEEVYGIDSEKNTGGKKKSLHSKLHSLDNRPPSRSSSSNDKNSFISNVKKKIVYPAISHPLIPVRLKSGEILKISKPVFCRLRDLSKNNLLKPSSTNANGIEIQSVTKPNIIHVPFTDRLSGALGKLNYDSLHESKSKPVIHGKNGRITKTVKLRAALDKSTVAWASTTRLKPKTSLLDQLNSLTYVKHQPAPSILSQTKKTIIPTVPSSSSSPLKSPVVIKLKPKISEHKMTTLSNALKKIEQNEIVPNGVVNLSTQSKNFFDSYISAFDNCKATSFQKHSK